MGVSEMLTPMTNEYERREAALERIQDRYCTPREREDQERFGGSRRMPVHEALMRVSSVADARDGEHPYNYAPADPDGEDLLAALALVAEAREQLETVELRLIRQARTREITWTDIAVPLGLRTRQSAESRALRLERAHVTAHGSRDVGRMRAAKAGERDLQQWATDTETRLRTAAEALVDSSEAWAEADLGDRMVFNGYVQVLATRLVSGSPGPALWSGIEAVAFHLLPRDRRAPKPTGAKATAAAAAVHEVEQLRMLARNARGFRW